LAIVLGWLLLGIAAPLLTSVDPLKTRSFVIIGTRTIPPPFEPGMYGYPLGSDNAGRDVWVEVMYGARATLTIAFAVLAARLIAGTALGAVAGWFAGRPVDRVVSALTDAFAAFPTILFALLWIRAQPARRRVGVEHLYRHQRRQRSPANQPACAFHQLHDLVELSARGRGPAGDEYQRMLSAL